MSDHTESMIYAANVRGVPPENLRVLAAQMGIPIDQRTEIVSRVKTDDRYRYSKQAQ